MANWNEIGKELIKDGIFVRFPELIPAVGEPNYWKGEHSKLLLVGESNYFEDKFGSISDFKEPNKWYFGGNDRLIPDEKKISVDNWKGSRGHNNIFKSMKTVLDEVGKNYDKDLLQEAAYYNYFLRPASVTKANKGFEKDCKEIDCQVSYSALCGIIDEIKPNIVIFVSKYSHNKFMEYYKKEEIHFEPVVIDYVNHFSRACWSEPNGQQKFENLLREHWLGENTKYQKLRTIHNELRQKFKVEKDQECFFDKKGNFLSCLHFKINDYSFCCETGVKMNDVDFWTCFYETDNSKVIPQLGNNGYKFKPEFSIDKILEEIEKLINQIIEEISIIY